jgi:hypothetical protein
LFGRKADFNQIIIRYTSLYPDPPSLFPWFSWPSWFHCCLQNTFTGSFVFFHLYPKVCSQPLYLSRVYLLPEGFHKFHGLNFYFYTEDSKNVLFFHSSPFPLCHPISNSKSHKSLNLSFISNSTFIEWTFQWYLIGYLLILLPLFTNSKLFLECKNNHTIPCLKTHSGVPKVESKDLSHTWMFPRDSI